MFLLIVETSAEMLGQIGSTLVEFDIKSMIKNAVEKELVKYGININANSVRSNAVQSSSKTNNFLIDNDNRNGVDTSRARYFIVNNSNIGLNRSREYNCPNSGCLSKADQNWVRT